jgi:hypothetical protein
MIHGIALRLPAFISVDIVNIIGSTKRMMNLYPRLCLMSKKPRSAQLSHLFCWTRRQSFGQLLYGTSE